MKTKTAKIIMALVHSAFVGSSVVIGYIALSMMTDRPFLITEAAILFVVAFATYLFTEWQNKTR